jgi:threonine dehydrogenase-like Zn-dependent dehydrogenase
MKLPFVHGVDDLRLIDVERPRAGPRDAVVRVASAGICGSDLGRLKRGGIPGRPEPVPLGHELSGTVVEVGEEVTGRAIGDRVILDPLRRMVGNGGPEGGFADYLLVRDIVGEPGSLLPIPDEMSFDTGALVEPVAVALHAINRGGARAGDKVAIFGAGPIGLAIVLALRDRGVGDIVIFEPSAFRRERALRLGAAAAYDPRDTAPRAALEAHHGKALVWGTMPAVGTDLFIEASGAPGIVPDVVAMAGYGARLTLVAVQKQSAELNLSQMVTKELSITTAMGYPSELPDAIALLRDKAAEADELVSHRFAGEEVEAAFRVAGRPGEAAKVLIQYGG